ncbi:MAG: hypothetical protein H7138_14690 [Myxococcales bacterium]|nr:hypothetical protein [Myxococcales bacterium]
MFIDLQPVTQLIVGAASEGLGGMIERSCCVSAGNDWHADPKHPSQIEHRIP